MATVVYVTRFAIQNISLWNARVTVETLRPGGGVRQIDNLMLTDSKDVGETAVRLLNLRAWTTRSLWHSWLWIVVLARSSTVGCTLR